jgi:predicted RND superfamily exporter protein
VFGARFEALLLRLGLIQVRRPWRPVLLCLLVTVLASLLAARLELRTKFDQLLPQDTASVVELHRIAERSAASSRIFVLLEHDDRATLRAMGDAMVPRLRAIGAPWVTSADDGVHEARAFLLRRAGLFASIDELKKLSADVDERWDRAISKAIGSDLDEEPEKETSFAALEKQFLGEGRTRELERRYPDGYYESPDGRALVVLIRSTAQSGDLALSRATEQRVKSVVAEVAADARFAKVRVGYAGDLITSLYEYGIVRDDLTSVGLIGCGLVLLVVLIYFARMRALITMALTIGTGLAWTFGATYLAIGHLNVATGFLFSIVAGNGINCGIIYLARYLEARRGGEGVEAAVQTAHRETWLPTLTAAVAAGAAYASLAITAFRGFKHFAVIGATGMILCWIATYTLTPALIAITERMTPFVADNRRGALARVRTRGSRYDAPFAFLVPRAPRILALVGLAGAVFGFTALMRWASSDPMEYDLTRTQVARNQSADIYRVSDVAKGILGQKTDGGMLVLVDRLDQIEPLRRELEKKRDAARPGDKPFEAVHTLLDFVPPDQETKLPILAAIGDKLTRAHDKGLIADDDWQKLAAYVPPKELRAFGISALPEDIARPFTEKDGTRGRLVFVEPSAGKDEDDLRYLLLWADAFRETRLPTGEVLHGSGRAVIFADMLRAVIADVPRAVGASLALTIIAVLVTFRRGGRALWVLGALAVGIAWMGAYLAVSHTRINFLNFIALPITFGIGADYAVNVMQRYESSGDVRAVLRSTGGAVVLCSLTTIVGYLALVRSINQAVQSLGMLAVVGEIACLAAALLVLPAILLLRDRFRAVRPEQPQQAP